MRVYATARASPQSNAVGPIELECTLAGLAVGFYGVGAYSDGYTPAAAVTGTHLLIPWAGVRVAHAAAEDFYLELEAPGLPHNRLTLTRFVHGPGVPLAELRQRRLVLHLAALSLAVAASFIAAALGTWAEGGSLAWGALGYGAVAALLVLAVGYGLDQRLFLRPPGEEQTRATFLDEFARHYPAMTRGDALVAARKPFELPNLAGFLPRTTVVVGITLAAATLTALITGKRVLRAEDASVAARAVADEGSVGATVSASNPSPVAGGIPAEPRASAMPPPAAPDVASASTNGTDLPSNGNENVAAVERRCACDRADSPLWPGAVPRLTALLLDQRLLTTRSSMRTQLEVAIINNGDTPVNDVTLLVQFYDKKGNERVPTQERPLYFAGPLRPGQAIKWTAEARGSEFDILAPDIGPLGPNGEGAAPADSFFELLTANHRPVRLHAARMLGYLDDSRAKEAALGLKDALRSQEAPYLRRVLAALGELRTCDVEVDRGPGQGSVAACVFNASSESKGDIGLQIQALTHSLDVNQPLAHPPLRVAEKKWKIVQALDPQAGVYVRVPLSPELAVPEGKELELLADRYDLLE